MLTTNPLPSVTGRVCHHPCETGCNRGHYDEAIAVHNIERYLGDQSGDMIRINGPVVIVTAKLPARTFVADGKGVVGAQPYETLEMLMSEAGAAQKSG